MSNSRRLQRVALLTFAAMSVFSAEASAQVCYGGPSGTNVAYEYGMVTFGESHGASVALVGKRTSLTLGARVGDIDDVSTQEGALRFAIHLPMGKVTVCPSLGLGYFSHVADPAPDFKVTTRTGAVRAGVGVGFEQEVYNGISLIPFVAARFDFRAIYITLDAPNTDAEESGDTLSTVEFEYGAAVKWKMLFAGIGAQRNSDSGDRPHSARIFLGFTFGKRD